MATLQGGIFSRPRGKTGGIVFGAARTRNGKLVTSRLLVKPSNPNTPSQQVQRSKFSSGLFIVRAIGPQIYQTDFNRSVGQLPGFQSMESIFLKNLGAANHLETPADINLGTLHFPDTKAINPGAAGEADITFSSELGGNGTTADEVQAILIPQDQANRTTPSTIVLASATRADGSITVTGLQSSESYVVMLYLRGAGVASGLLSLVSSSSIYIV